MAFSDDIENEGAIDTGDENAGQDNSGAAPVMAAPDDNSGVPAIPMDDGPRGEGGPQPRGDGLQAIADAGKQTPVAAAKQFPGNAKRIISYLMGADAQPPQSLDEAAAQVDPEGRLPQGDRNLLAIDAVANQGGPQAAWPLVQANRVAYNAKQAFAKVALTGTPQKPADINAAVDAANQAQSHVLDGSNVQFAAGPGGVTATVTMPGSSQPQRIMLSPDQFSRWLDVGGDGQWDKVMEHSAPATLQRIASEGARAGMATIGPAKGKAPRPQQAAAPQPQAATGEEAVPSAPAYNPRPQRTKAQITGQAQAYDPTEADMSPIPGTHDADGHYLGPKEPDQTGYGAELEARSRKIFPDVGSESQRQQWMAAQEEKEIVRQHDIDVAGAKGTSAQEVARIQAGGKTAAASITAEGKLKGWQYSSDAKLKSVQAQVAAKVQQMENSNANAAQTRALKLVQTKLLTGKELAPSEQAFVDKLPAAAEGSQPTRAPQQVQQHGAGASQGAAHNVPPVGQRVVNQTYDTPKGKFTWMGNGWQPAQ